MVVFLGAPGAGKGTQARLLAKLHDFKIFAIGEILRNEVAESTVIGVKIAKSLEQGEFASTGLIMELFKKHVNNVRCILDGFPRTLEQAHALEEFIEESHLLEADKLLVIDFVMPVDDVISRLIKRRICKTCNAPLHIEHTECSFCQTSAADAYKRNDDNEAIIKKRIKKFEEETLILRDFYKVKGVYQFVDALATTQDVYEQIRSCIIAKNLL